MVKYQQTSAKGVKTKQFLARHAVYFWSYSRVTARFTCNWQNKHHSQVFGAHDLTRDLQAPYLRDL